MYYRGYLSPIACPRCGTLNNQIREECRFCDGPLVNYCTDEECDCENQREARFCKKCGRPTIFAKHRVFDEKYCAVLRLSAQHYYEVNGDPDSPEYKAEQARLRREYRQSSFSERSWRYGGSAFDDDDFPEPPLEPDYIPYY